MDSNPFQDDVLNRFVSFSDWDSLDPIQCVKAIHYATKNRELVIKVGCRCVGYEELAPNRVWAFSSEPHNAPSVVFQTIHELTEIKAKDSMDGHSLVPILKNPKNHPKRPAMLMSNVRTSFSSSTPKGAKGIQKKVDKGAKAYDGMPMYMMIVVDNRYKYVRHLLKDTVEEI